MLLAGRSQSSGLSSLLGWVADPVDSWVISDGLAAGVDHDHFVVFVSSVLSDPVRVQDSETFQSSADRFLGSALQVLVELQTSDTGRLWLSVDDSLWDWELSASSSDSSSVDDVALLLSVAESTSSLDSRWARDSVDGGELSVLPDSESEDVLHDFALLLFPKFLEVFVGTHL